MSPIVIDPTATPERAGLSFQLSLIVTSPELFPFTINFVPDSLNFATSPGELETILKVAFKSNPLGILSSNSIFLLPTTLLPAPGST